MSTQTFPRLGFDLASLPVSRLGSHFQVVVDFDKHFKFCTTSGEHVPAPPSWNLRLISSSWKRKDDNLIILLVKYSIAVSFIDFSRRNKVRARRRINACRELISPSDTYAAIKLAPTVAMIHPRIREFRPPSGATGGKM